MDQYERQDIYIESSHVNMTRTTREVQATSCVSLGGGITPRFGGSGGGVCIKESFEEVEFKLGLEER